MKVIITGTTGMVGEGVLLECLTHPQVMYILSVSRKTTGVTHPKLEEHISAFVGVARRPAVVVSFDQQLKLR